MLQLGDILQAQDSYISEKQQTNPNIKDYNSYEEYLDACKNIIQNTVNEQIFIVNDIDETNE